MSNKYAYTNATGALLSPYSEYETCLIAVQIEQKCIAS